MHRNHRSAFHRSGPETLCNHRSGLAMMFTDKITGQDHRYGTETLITDHQSSTEKLMEFHRSGSEILMIFHRSGTEILMNCVSCYGDQQSLGSR